jgi:hypothetical protein
MSPPSTDSSATARTVGRRGLLAAVGAAATGLAGCTALGRTEPRSLNPPALLEDDPNSRIRAFPGSADERDRIVRTNLGRIVPEGRRPVRFGFSATVPRGADYHHHRIRLRVEPPREDRPPAPILVRPPSGGFTGFRVFRRARATVIVLEDLETRGTLTFGFVVDETPPPETLSYGFEVIVDADDRFGRRAVASAAGEFPVARDHG